MLRTSICGVIVSAPAKASNLSDRISLLWQTDILLRQAIDPDDTLAEVVAKALKLRKKLSRAAGYVFEDDEEIWPMSNPADETKLCCFNDNRTLEVDQLG